MLLTLILVATASTGLSLPAKTSSATVSASSAAFRQGVAQDTNRLLVGLVIRGNEVAAFEVIRSDQLYLPLEALLELTGATLEEDEHGLHIETPLGSTDLENEDLIVIDGERFLAETTIRTKLASPIRFDREAFAIDMDLAWPAPFERTTRTRGPQLVPEARPPAFSLSTLRVDGQYVDSELDGRRTIASSLLAGRAFSGRWQTRWIDDLDGGTRLQDYAWVRSAQRSLWLAGHQRVQLHPLLPGIELSGVQAAFTNQSLSLFSRSFEPGELLPRRLRPVDSFTGSGPPAGLAELRVDGIVLAVQTIGLNGLFEFYDVPVSGYSHSRTEIWLYDRHNLRVPVEIQDRTRTTSSFLLPAGAFVHQTGAGYGGNILQDAIDDRDGGEASGFYQGRFGLTSNLTLESVVQRAPGRFQAMAGMVARPFTQLVVSASVGASGGAFAYHLELEGRSQHWRLLGRSQLRETGFGSDTVGELFDHFLDLAYTPSQKLEFGLIGRSRKQLAQRSSFVLPVVAWRPSQALSLRARTDEEGNYIVDLFSRLNRFTRVSAHLQKRTSADVAFSLTRRSNLFVGAEMGAGSSDRYSLHYQFVGAGRRRPLVSAGVLYADGNNGYQVRTSAAVGEGLMLRVELEDDPLRILTKARNRRLTVGMVADLAFSSGRLTAARSRSLRHDRGGIVGEVVVENGGQHGEYRLDELKILLNGRPMATTSSGGRFFVGNLREGVFQLQLDAENLPIELRPVRDSVVVQVAGGAVTRVELSVRPEYGIAGRVTDMAGGHVAGLRVQLVDHDGAIAGSAVTDRFGLYRIDGLPPGTYTLRTEVGQLPPGEDEPGRTVVITDDFLFSQDLLVPDRIDPATATLPRH